MREPGRIVNVREAGSPSDCLSPGRAAAIPWQGRIRSSVLARPMRSMRWWPASAWSLS